MPLVFLLRLLLRFFYCVASQITMKLFAWNCRGLAQAATVQTLKALVNTHQPDAIFLSETKISCGKKISKTMNSLGFNKFEFVPSKGLAGGLCFAWVDKLDVTILCASHMFINIIIVSDESVSPWMITCVYGPTIPVQKSVFWQELAHIADSFTGPWIAIGDFNAILFSHEKRGGRSFGYSAGGFSDLSAKHGLIDLGFTGNPFTWSNKRWGKANIKERLDRAIVNAEWRIRFPRANINHLPAINSDHNPILLSTSGELSKRRRTFKFEDAWLRDETSHLVVEKAWDISVRGSPMYQLTMRIKETSQALKVWNKYHFGFYQQRKKDIFRAIDDIQNREASIQNLAREKALQDELNEQLTRECIFWRQRSREKWLREGDANTRFFHLSTIIRRRRNSIEAIKKEDGTWATEWEQIGDCFSYYFTELFKSSNPQIPPNLDVLMGASISEEVNQGLCAIPTIEEIKKTVFAMPANKAPGPDEDWGFVWLNLETSTQFWVSDIFPKMDNSRNRRVDKREYEDNVFDAEGGIAQLKKPKLPGLASVIVEAVKLDNLQKLGSSIEPLFRRIVSEEVERALKRLGHAKVAGRSSPPRLQGPEGKNLQLHFRTRMPPHLFTGGKVEGEQGAAVHVVLLDVNTGNVVQTGPESVAKLNVVVLEGDFNEETDEDWTKEQFESHEVKEREGKRPILTGDLQAILKEGVGTLGDLIFTDNSSWIRSRKFRLGVKVAPGCCDELRVREAKTEAFAVKDHRGELYKKHYPPALHDEVWRLDRIAKDGALHKKLMKAEIITVEDFLRVLVRDPKRLRNILGSGMSNRMWENTVEHAKTCVLGGKLYVYYADGAHSTGAIFDHIYELRGLISDGQFLPLESLTDNQKVPVDSLVKNAYENWSQVVEYDGKVLHALPHNNKGTRDLTAPIADHNHDMDHPFTITQNRQQYISSEPGPHCRAKSSNPLIPQLIEFPFTRSDSEMGMTSNSQQVALSGCLDYGSVGVSAAGDNCLSGDWSQPRNGQTFEDFFSQEIRLRSSEMLESNDMQRLLRTFGMSAGVSGSGFSHSDEVCYTYNIPYERQEGQGYGQDRSRGSGKAFVGWLKLRAALRWGIFIRKQAAERRAQLVELD